jgi:rubrerythrin
MMQSGGCVSAMLILSLKRLERIVQAQYQAWKEALTETGYPLTSDALRRIADDAAKTLDNATGMLVESLKHQCRGMEDTIEQMKGAIEQEVYAIRARFRQDYEVEISKAKIAERKPVAPVPPTARPSNPSPVFSFVRDADLRRIAERDYGELQALDVQAATKSVLIMAGSIIESLVMDATVASGAITKEKADQMTLQELLAAAAKTGIVLKTA